MKPLILFPLIAALLSSTPTGKSAEAQQPARTQQKPLDIGELKALEHACKLVAAVNALDWKTAEATTPAKDVFLPLLKRDATSVKEWPGIGGYRRSDRRSSDQVLSHCFTYGPGHANPHEVWFQYSIDGDKFTFVGINILGW